MARYTAQIAREQTNRFLKKEELLYPETRDQMDSIYALINIKADRGESQYRDTAFPGKTLDETDSYFGLSPLIEKQLEYDGYSIQYEYDEEKDFTFMIIRW